MKNCCEKYFDSFLYRPLKKHKKWKCPKCKNVYTKTNEGWLLLLTYDKNGKVIKDDSKNM